MEKNYNLKFNNKWQDSCELVVKDEGYRAACESRGIRVYDAQEVLRPFLPDLGTSDEELQEYTKNATVQGPIENQEDHPYYNERVCKEFNAISRLIKYEGLNQAKSLTNTVEIQEGLPTTLLEKIASIDGIMPYSEALMMRILQDSMIFDATQTKLPKNVFVPHIGWTPVIDQMNRPLPYPEPKFSFGRNVRREYGIPNTRKNLNMLREVYHGLDMLSVEYSYLTERQHHENYILRQFFEKDEDLVKVHSPIAYMVTADKSLEPYAKSSEIQSTKSKELPDLGPLNSLSYFFEKNIYLHENNFPYKENVKILGSDFLPQVHTAIEVNNGINGGSARLDQDIYGRSLIMAFTSALGQARLNYGADVSGVLPKPITLHFINTTGKKFHFSVFQLTLWI